MIGAKTCSMCKHYKGLSELNGKDRVEFIHTLLLLNKDPSDYGWCVLHGKAVYKWEKNVCPDWEVDI